MVDQQKFLGISRTSSILDEHDFVVFIRQNQNRIYRLAYCLLGNHEDAQDAVQGTFIRAWEHRDKIIWNTSQPWLLKITVNLCLDWLRRRKFKADYAEADDKPQVGFEVQLSDPKPDPLEQCITSEMQAKVHKAIMDLPPRYLVVIAMRDFEGLSYEDISQILKISIGKVKSDLFRGRRELRNALRCFLTDNAELEI